MNEEEKQRRLEEIRKSQEAFAKQASKAFPRDPRAPRIGSFAEDDPEIHQRFANRPKPE